MYNKSGYTMKFAENVRFKQIGSWNGEVLLLIGSDYFIMNRVFGEKESPHGLCTLSWRKIA